MRSASIVIFLCVGMTSSADNWPQWRGPTGDSTCAETKLPLKWSAQDNLLWKTTIPGEGASTPAVWGDAIFVSSQDDDKLLLLRLNKLTGAIEWSRQVGQAKTPRGGASGKDGGRRRQKFHELHNLASPSPVTDGERVVVHFGTGDLAAYDFSGRQLWNRNLQNDHGRYTIWWGHANSPVMHGNLVISVCMQDSLSDLGAKPSESYVVAHDKQTGKEVWKTLRMTNATAEECDSYITPVFHRNAEGVEMIVVGGDTMDAYDPLNGKRLWQVPGLAKSRIITGPTVANGTVYATRGMRGDLYAVRTGSDQFTWKFGKGTPDSCCPVVWKDLVFWVSDDGIARCHNAITGEEKWVERLGTDFKASPVAAAGRIYFLDRGGKCTIVEATDKFKKLAENLIDDEMKASPAMADGRIYLRGKNAVYCIGNE